MFTQLETLEHTFSEKKKEFEKIDKEYTTTRRKLYKEIDQFMTKVGKNLKTESIKHNKKRKTGNSGKGGFNKEMPVPLKLRKYLELPDDVLMSRPKVTKMLNIKFIEEGFRNTTATKEDGTTKSAKELKITNKKSAKILGCEHNKVIEFENFQGFIAAFYNEEKQQKLAEDSTSA